MLRRRFIGRIHLAGQAAPFIHRPDLDTGMGWQAREGVVQSQLVPAQEHDEYSSATSALLDAIDQALAEVTAQSIRLHGDCHHGNILWTEQGPHFVDLDDCRNGPAIQDLWMLMSGERHERESQLQMILEGYLQFCDFNRAELQLVEALRTLRMLHHAAWLATRWQDPAFPIAFPWFGEPRYWEELVLGLREQLGRMQEEPIQIPF